MVDGIAEPFSFAALGFGILLLRDRQSGTSIQPFCQFRVSLQQGIPASIHPRFFGQQAQI